MTHVLLPVTALPRRADAASVIASTLARKATRWVGFRRIAAELARPAETVRGWLRRFAERAEAVRSVFTVWLRGIDFDPVMPEDGARTGFPGAHRPVRAASAHQPADHRPRWIRDWRAGGFDALVPSSRQCTPRTPAEVLELAVALRRENPQRTAAAIQRSLRTPAGLGACTVHSETGQTPLDRWCAGGPFPLPSTETLTEAFL